MSAAHKKALVDGRTMSATVDRYLVAVNTPRRRGRKVSVDTLQSRLETKTAEAKSEIGVGRVLALQDVRDLERQIGSFASQTGDNLKMLEAEFVKIAKRFGENRKITYGAWRDSGVPAVVLKKAGIARTRSS